MTDQSWAVSLYKLLTSLSANLSKSNKNMEFFQKKLQDDFADVNRGDIFETLLNPFTTRINWIGIIEIFFEDL